MTTQLPPQAGAATNLEIWEIFETWSEMFLQGRSSKRAGCGWKFRENSVQQRHFLHERSFKSNKSLANFNWMIVKMFFFN